MQVASYFASLQIRLDKKSVNLVDKTLKDLQKKLLKFKNLKIKLEVNKFNIDSRKLETSLGNALDVASTRVVFDITRFAVNDRALLAAIIRAMRGLPPLPPLPPGPNPPPRPPRPHDPTPNPPRRDYIGAGGVAGFAARAYVPALAIAGGGYGMGALNRMNQEVISAQLTTQAVTEAAGIIGQGPAAFDWLRNQGNRIGFSYMDQAESYNNFLSNSLGAGMSLSGSQDIYLGFAEYSRAMGTGPARNKLVMNALSQMMGKGTVSMEELKKQMAESMPGTMDVFATAYAQMTGSGKTGQDALAALYEAVPKGKINSAEILPIVSEILRQRAAPKLNIAMKTSQAEQARAKNQLADTAMLASRSGVESGFARLWKSLTTAMKEATPAVEALAKGFDEISKYVSFAALLPQSLKRAFEGRDSWVADMLGEEKLKIVKDFFDSTSEFRTTVKETFGHIIDGWKLVFETFGGDFLAIATKIGDILTYSLKLLNAYISGDSEGIKNAKAALAGIASGASHEDIVKMGLGTYEEKKDLTTPEQATSKVKQAELAVQANDATEAEGIIQNIAKFGVGVSKRIELAKARGTERTVTLNPPFIPNPAIPGETPFDRATMEMDRARAAAVNDKSSLYYQDPKGFDQFVKDQQMAAAMDQALKSATNNNQLTIAPGAIVINAPSGDAQVLSDTLMSALERETSRVMSGFIQTAMPVFPNTGN